MYISTLQEDGSQLQLLQNQYARIWLDMVVFLAHPSCSRMSRCIPNWFAWM